MHLAQPPRKTCPLEFKVGIAWLVPMYVLSPPSVEFKERVCLGWSTTIQAYEVALSSNFINFRMIA